MAAWSTVEPDHVGHKASQRVVFPVNCSLQFSRLRRDPLSLLRSIGVTVREYRHFPMSPRSGEGTGIHIAKLLHEETWTAPDEQHDLEGGVQERVLTASEGIGSIWSYVI